jgi:hypothetical protein
MKLNDSTNRYDSPIQTCLNKFVLPISIQHARSLLTAQTPLDHLSDPDGNRWLLHHDFVTSADTLIEDWAPAHGTSNIIGLGNDVFGS